MIEGIINIDKPSGMTSHDVVYRVRRAAQTKRVGHAGTLDPAATGILLLCIGRATRLVEYLVGRPKTYVGQIKLGETTNTYDADGEIVLSRPVPELNAASVDQALEQFRGDILQIPPMVSAIKKDGQPLYKLARQGKEVDRPPRPITIYALHLKHFAAPFLEIEVTCSAGTYIRSIAHDLGETLGCGGHLTTLRRTAVGRFALDTALPLDQLDQETIEAHLLPADNAVEHLPPLYLNQEETENLTFGRPIPRRPDGPEAELVRVYGLAGNFMGLVTQKGNIWKPKKLFID
ncbi:MAG: tRNA pseudouridine(55) synthase TruB [Chloroflexota bacterium]